MREPLPQATYIHTFEGLQDLAAILAREPMFAIDTESNSLYAYRERVCLIQISTRDHDYIVDPLIIVDMRPLGPLLANPAIEKVFHAAEYDLICLKRDYGFSVNHVFDTMIAARICGHKAVGLGSLLQEFHGVAIDKRHQRDDWGQRPLPPDSLLYAQMDTHYLLDVRDRLAASLTEMGRWREAQESFVEATLVATPDVGFDPDGFWRLGLPNHLNQRQMSVLRELYLLREQLAEHHDVPIFKIFSDRTVLQLAQIAPHNTTDLYGIDGMSQGQIRRYGKQVLQAVTRGEQTRLPSPPAPQPPARPDVVDCYSALREWRKARALERGVESDVIISRGVLWSLAEKRPTTLDAMSQIPGLGPWRLAQYGEELLGVLAKCKPRPQPRPD